MVIIDKTTKLTVGDLLLLREDRYGKYVGAKRLICRCDDSYVLVSLDKNEVYSQQYTSVEEIYEQWKDEIVQVVKKKI